MKYIITPSHWLLATTACLLSFQGIAVSANNANLRGGGRLRDINIKQVKNNRNKNKNTPSYTKPPPNVKKIVQSDCIIQVAALLHIPNSNDNTNINDDDHEVFDCELDPSDTDGYVGLTRALIMDDTQKRTMKQLWKEGKITPGKSKLRIGGLAEVDSREVKVPHGFDVRQYIKNDILKNKDKNKNKGNSRYHSNGFFNRRRLDNGGTLGDKPILAVRVTDKNGKVRPESAAQISDDIFGTANDPVNLKSQLEACSMGKLNIIPGDNNAIDWGSEGVADNPYAASGVIEVTIDVDLETAANRYDVKNAVTRAVEDKLGFSLPGPYDQVMYVLEKCYNDCGWAAYAYINSWNSVYQNVYYKYTGVLVHEFGHNFGLAHSGGLDGRTYTDHTGMMGNPLYSDDEGKMCYNAAKNWQLDWYNDRKKLIEPLKFGSTWSEGFQLVGIADYLNESSNDIPVVAKIETNTDTDYFLGFNRATGVNEQNDEADDELTIIEAGNNGNSYSQSFLKAHLVAGESYSFDNFGGSGNSLVIRLTSIEESDNGPWKANVVVGTNGATPAPSPGPGTGLVPTKNPTLQPTLPPTPEPTVNPTAPPTSKPTSVCSGGLDEEVTIEILTDNYPQETSWEIVNNCTLNTVETSPSYTENGKAYSETYCLAPSMYTFVLKDTYGDGFCCGYGRGSYKVYYRGNEVASGGEFTSIESTTFGMESCGPSPTPPPTHPPSSPPTAPPTPAPSFPPTTLPPTNAPTKNPTKAPSAPPTSTPSPPPTTLPPTNTPTKNPTKAPTAPPTPAPSSPPTTLPPTSEPTDPPSPQPTLPPTLPPSPSPTNLPSPPPTNVVITPEPTGQPTTPAPTPCTGMEIKVDILTDNYPLETSWSLYNTCTSNIVMSSPQDKYTEANTLYSDTYCMPQGEYKFKMEDSYGDGICCGYGLGSYNVFANGDVMASGGEFVSSEESSPFGSCGVQPITPPPTPNPTNQPTTAPPTKTPSNPPTFAAVVVATYDVERRAPQCSTIGSACTSGTLLEGVGADGTENNAPNSLDSCTDGSQGVYLTDESVEKITISSTGDGPLQAGRNAKIEVVIHSWGTGASDTADFYYTADATNPTWNYIGSLQPGSGGIRTLSMQYVLPSGNLQAVRVINRYLGNVDEAGCSGGSFDDVDDLVFSVLDAPEGPDSLMENNVPIEIKEVAPPKPVKIDCQSLKHNENRCIAASPLCEWRSKNNGNRKSRGCFESEQK